MTKINKDIIFSTEDTLNMLDQMLEKWDKGWWENFYKDKEKPIPFFVDDPDENLMSFIEKSGIRGKSLDIGCGNGRNAIYLAKKGFDSFGIDLASEPIKWAKGNAEKYGVEVNFDEISFFDYHDESQAYHHIHDSGCMHHIKPHRRAQYLEKVHQLLSDDGCFTLVCFNLNGGTNVSDYEVYEQKSMKGGLGFSEEKLRKILTPYFDVTDMRVMNTEMDNAFGTELCWAVTMKKKIMLNDM